MVLGWRRRKSNNAQNKKKNLKPMTDIEIPSHFLCPISLDLMRDPVTLSSGITYDRDSIETWLECGSHHTCPVTNQALRSSDLVMMVPNHALRKMIQAWCAAHRDAGVQRIPTPRVPVSPARVVEVLLLAEAAAGRRDARGCLECVRRVQRWGRESERDGRCVVACGAARALSSAFECFVRDGNVVDSSSNDAGVCEEILSALTWMFPLGEVAIERLSSEASLRCMVSFLTRNDDNDGFSTKQNSAMVLEELVNNSYGDDRGQLLEALANVGVVQVLMELVRSQICPKITKSSLMLIFHFFSSENNYHSSEKTRSEFLEMGLVSLVLELLVESEKGVISERALSVMDGLCGSQRGREMALDNALTIPVLVKKLLRVSDLATEFSVSAIWKLCRNVVTEKEDNHELNQLKIVSAIVEALQVGAFQKLLLIIQVGCAYETKEKATELLKLLNPYRPELECIESVDFKSLKRSF